MPAPKLNARGWMGAHHLRLGICSTVRLPCHTERLWWAIVFHPENYRCPTAPRPQPQPRQLQESGCTKPLHRHTIRLTPWASGKETQPGVGSGVRYGCEDGGAPGRHASARTGWREGETSRDRGVPFQEASPPNQGTHTHRQTQGRRRRGSKGGSPKQRESQRSDKTLAGRSPCWERARSSQLLM